MCRRSSTTAAIKSASHDQIASARVPPGIAYRGISIVVNGLGSVMSEEDNCRNRGKSIAHQTIQPEIVAKSVGIQREEENQKDVYCHGK